MLRLAADENFNQHILTSLTQRVPALDVVLIRDTAVYEAADDEVLEWCAREGRVLLTHDFRTIPRYAYARILAGQPMPGVIEVDRDLPIAGVVEDILLLIECSYEGEWEGRVLYLPL